MDKKAIVICSEVEWDGLRKLSFREDDRQVYDLRVYTPTAKNEDPLPDLSNARLWIGILEGAPAQESRRILKWIETSFDAASKHRIDQLLFIKDEKCIEYRGHIEQNRPLAPLTRFTDRAEGVESGLSDVWFKDYKELPGDHGLVIKSFKIWRDQQKLQRPGDDVAQVISHPDDLLRPREFIGRQTLLEQLTQDLSNHKHVLLHGFAGIGKTALGVEAAIRVIDITSANIMWMIAGESEPIQILNALAAPFFQKDRFEPMALSQKQEGLRDKLSRENIRLVVLDDAWNWNEDRVRVILRALPEQTALLVTARSPFELLKAYQIDSLTPPESLALLRANMEPGLLANEEKAAEQLCDYLNNLAFAVELAGKYMQQYGIHPSELFKRIQQPTPFSEKDKTEKGAPQRSLMLGKRENAIESLLDASVRDLKRHDPSAYKVLLHLGAMFVPVASKKLLSLLLPPSDAVALDTLQKLDLVKFEPTAKEHVAQYRLHSITYDYLQRFVIDQNREDVLAACIRYIGDHAEKPTQANFIALDSELNNIVGAAAFAAHYGWDNETDTVKLGYKDDVDKRYGDFLTVISELVTRIRLFEYRGSRQKEIALLENAIKLSKKLEREGPLAALRNARATVHINQGQYDAAEKQLQTALSYVQKLDNAGTQPTINENLSILEMQLSIKSNLAVLYKEKGDLESAQRTTEECLQLARCLGDTTTEAGQLLNLGNTYHKHGSYQKALEAFEAADALPVSHPRLTQMIKGSLANIYVEMKQYDHALALFKVAIEDARQSGDIYQEALWEANVGKVCWLTGCDREGIEPLKHSIEVMRDHGDLRGQTNAWGHLGNIYINLEDYDEALKAHKEALQISEKLGDRRNMGLDYGNIGLVYSLLGKHKKEARKNFKEARDIFNELGLYEEAALAERNIRRPPKAANRAKSSSSPSRTKRSGFASRINLSDLAMGLALGGVLGIVGGLMLRWWSSYVPADGFSVELLLSSALVTPFLYCAGFFAVLLSPLSNRDGTAILIVGAMSPVGFIAGASAGLIGGLIGGLIALIICLYIEKNAHFTARLFGDDNGGSAAMFKMLFLAPLGGGIIGGLIGEVPILLNVFMAVLIGITGMAGGMALQAVLGHMGLERDNRSLFPNGWLAFAIMLVLVLL